MTHIGGGEYVLFLPRRAPYAGGGGGGGGGTFASTGKKGFTNVLSEI